MRFAGILAFAGMLCAAAPARAADVILTHVSLDAPASCPGRARFEDELHRRSERVALVSRERADAVIDAKIDPAPGDAFLGTLRLTVGATVTTRQLSGASCETLVGAMALSAAVLLDPEGARTDDGDAPVPPAPPPTPPPALPAPPAPPSPPPPALTPAPPSWHARAGLGARLTTAFQGVDPTLALRADAGRSVGRMSPELSLVVEGTLGHTVSRSAGSIAFSGGGAELGVAPHAIALGESVALVPALVLEGFLVAMNAPSAALDQPSLRVFLSTGLAVPLVVRFGPWTALVEVEGQVHLLHEHFRIEPRGEVFALPPVYGTAGIFLSRSIF